MRISFAISHERTIQDVNRKQEDIDRLSSMIASGKKLLAPSDDPSAWANAMELKQGLREIETFQDNIQFGLSWGRVTDVSLDHLSNLIDQAKRLALEDVSGVDPESQQAHVQTLDQILDDALDIANSKYGDRYLFRAVADLPTDPPFELDDATGVVTVNGADGEVRIRTGKGQNDSTPINVNGADVFGDASQSILHDLWALREAVAQNQPASIEALIGNLDAAQQNVRDQGSLLASRMVSLETQKEALGAFKLNDETRLSGLEDADMAEMITKFQQQRTAFEATLRVTAMLDDLNLMNFL